MVAFMRFAVLLFASSSLLSVGSAGSLDQNFVVNWGNDHVKTLNNGDLLTLSLDKSSGSGFQSKNLYHFGSFQMQMKLVPGNSAGTVTTLYLKSLEVDWDEIDLEFLGNLSGDPYILHTNIFTQGKGNREQQFYLWFDPTTDFHTYSILWNPNQIVLFVDETPIRQFKYSERVQAFPKNQAMRIYASLWNADDWATRGGLVKTDWTQAPFTAAYQNFKADACVTPSTRASLCSQASSSNPSWIHPELDADSIQKMKEVQKNFMIYNYCSDTKRFPAGLPPECFTDP